MPFLLYFVKKLVKCIYEYSSFLFNKIKDIVVRYVFCVFYLFVLRRMAYIEWRENLPEPVLLTQLADLVRLLH